MHKKRAGLHAPDHALESDQRVMTQGTLAGERVGCEGAELLKENNITD